MRPLRGALRAATLWLLAALIHLRVTPEHPEEWWGYVPLFGPGAGEVEGVGFVDSCATATEVGIAEALGAAPLRGTSAESRKRREDVRDKLTTALSDRADGFVFEAGAMRVGEYLDRWLKDVEGTVRESTHQRYEYAVGPHIKPALGRIKLKDLGPAQVRWFYRDRLDSGLAPASLPVS